MFIAPWVSCVVTVLGDTHWKPHSWCASMSSQLLVFCLKGGREDVLSPTWVPTSGNVGKVDGWPDGLKGG